MLCGEGVDPVRHPRLASAFIGHRLDYSAIANKRLKILMGLAAEPGSLSHEQASSLESKGLCNAAAPPSDE